MLSELLGPKAVLRVGELYRQASASEHVPAVTMQSCAHGMMVLASSQTWTHETPLGVGLAHAHASSEP
jgi:hypothetical protein